MKGVAICPLCGKEKYDIWSDPCESCCWCYRSSRGYGIKSCDILRLKNKVNGKRGNWLLDVHRADESELYNIPANVQLPLLLIEFKEVKDGLRSSLETLTSREREIIIFRWGLDPEYYGSRIPSEVLEKWANMIRERWSFTTLNGAVPLEALAEFFGLTRERVRQIEAMAIHKLRHPTRLCKLAGLLGVGCND